MTTTVAAKRRPEGTLPPTERRARKRDLLPLYFLTPAALVLAVFILLPLVRSFVLSLFDASLLKPDAGDFVGLGNYVDLAQNPRFWNSLAVTLTYTICSVVLAYFVGLGTAMLLNRRFRLRWLARILMILPWAVPEVVAVMIFKWMLDAQFGIVNHLLMAVGVISEPVAWLNDPGTALVIVILTTVWIEYPLATLILLAGLQTVPEELMESAQLDGAGRWQRFRHVTMPLLRFVNIVVIILLSLDTFRRTTLIYTMTGGGPRQATETLPVWTYVEAFANHRLGSASAIGITVLLILGAATLSYFFTVIRKGER